MIEHTNLEVNWNWKPEDWINDPWHHPYAYETFKKYIPAKSNVLEVGFGSGRILSKLSKYSECYCTGVDIEDSAFHSLSFFCEYYHTNVNKIKGSGFNLPFKDNTFDVVYSEGVIEHFSHEQTQKMVLEHARVCKKNGLVIISVPNKFAVFHSIMKSVVKDKYPFYPERSYSIYELSELMEKAGLKITAKDGFAFGCQFLNFKLYFIDRLFPRLLPTLMWIGLYALKKIKLYHFKSPKINSILGFQVLVVGQKYS